MSLSCPVDEHHNTRGCNTSECCDDLSDCEPLVQGPCVCFSTGDAAGGTESWNYTFLAQCSGYKNVSTPWGAACSTLTGGDTYVCYCRPRKAGDQGEEGDRIDGNWIFDTQGQCRSFPGKMIATSSAISSPTSHHSGAAPQYAVSVSGSALALGILLLNWMAKIN